jgi:quercetin dioxygenase-like cupin family protein
MFTTKIDDKMLFTSPNGNKIYWMVTSESGAPNFEMRYIEIPAAGHTGYGSHAHEHEVYVVRGKGKVKGKDSEMVISEGSAIFIQENEEHQFFNESDTEVLGVICIVPKGAEAQYKPSSK